MAYQKRNFKKDQLLTADDLNAMDDQIASNEESAKKANDDIKNKLDKSAVVQEKGNSETAVMSQAAATKEFGKLSEEIANHNAIIGTQDTVTFHLATGETHSSTKDPLRLNLPQGTKYIVRVDTNPATVIGWRVREGYAAGGSAEVMETKRAIYGVAVLETTQDTNAIGLYVQEATNDVDVTVSVETISEISGAISKIDSVANNENKAPVLGVFMRGSLTATGGEYGQDRWAYRIRNVDPVLYDKTTEIGVEQGYRYYVDYYDSQGEFVEAVGWLEETHTIPAGSYVKLLVAKSLATESENDPPADVYEMQSKIYIKNAYPLLNDFAAARDELHYTTSPVAVSTVAHRGDTKSAPENTIAALRSAVRKGYKYAEIDIHFTSDGIPVLLHDETIDRTSNGTGNIAEMTLETARTYDFGSWFSNEYAGEKIPTFEEALAFCRATGLVPWIELKDQTQEQVNTLVALVKSYGLIEKVHWLSFDKPCLNYVYAAHNYSNLWWIVWGVSESNVTNMAQFLEKGNQIGMFHYRESTEADAVLLAQYGIAMAAGTITESSEVLALPKYVSVIVSDDVNASKILYKNAMGI